MDKLSFEDVEMDLNSKSETFDYEVVLKQLADTMRENERLLEIIKTSNVSAVLYELGKNRYASEKNLQEALSNKDSGNGG